MLCKEFTFPENSSINIPEIAAIDAVVEKLCSPIHVKHAIVNIQCIKECIENESISDTILTASEKKVYERCRITKRRADWLAGRIGAKLAVSSFFNTPCPEENEILPDENGAPYLSNHNGITISISHSGTVAIAIAAGFAVGIDVEQYEQRPEALINAVLNENEIFSVNKLEKNKRMQEVNRLWTCKEAVVKVGKWGGKKNFKMINCLINPLTIENRTIRHISSSTEKYAITLAYESAGGCRHG